MSDLVTAIDEAAANIVVPRSIAALPTQTASGASALGPFALNYSVQAKALATGVDLIPAPADVIRLTGKVDFTAALSISLDLSFLNFCLPQVCVTLPFIGRICTPRICLTFPTITVPLSHTGTGTFTTDLRLATTLESSIWSIDAVVVGVPSLALNAASAALLGTIGAAVSLALLAVPFIGPLLAVASAVIFAGITLAAVTGLLGPIITPFISSLRVNLFRQTQRLQLLDATASEAAVSVLLDSVATTITGGTEDELVLSIDISA